MQSACPVGKPAGMSGLFKPPAQESVFTLGDEDIADTDPVDITSYNKPLPKAAVPQPATHKDAALPVSSVAGATQGPLNGSSVMPPVDEIDLNSGKGADAPHQTHQSDPASGTSSYGQDVMSNAALQSASDHTKRSEHQLFTSVTNHKGGPSHTPQIYEAGGLGSRAQKGSEQPVNGTLTNEAAGRDEGRHLDEDEEQRIAEVGCQLPRSWQ